MAFDHWMMAEQLLEKQQIFPAALVKEAEKLGYESHVYLWPQSYLWLGHSLGGIGWMTILLG